MKQKLLFTLMFLMTWGTGSVWAQTAQSIPSTLDLTKDTYAVLTSGGGNWDDAISDMKNGYTATFKLNNAVVQYYRVSFEAYTNRTDVTLNFTIKNGETVISNKDIRINNTGGWGGNQSPKWPGAEINQYEYTTPQLPVADNLSLVITFKSSSTNPTANIRNIVFAANTNPQTIINNNGDATSLLSYADCSATTGWSVSSGTITQKSDGYYKGETAPVFEFNGGRSIYQTITGLPDGNYTVQLATRGGLNHKVKLLLNDSEVNEVTLVDGTGKNGNISSEDIVSTGVSFSNNGWLLLQGAVNVTEGKLKITLTHVSGSGGNWCQVSDIKVLFNADDYNDATYTYKTKAESGYVDLTSTLHHYFTLSNNAIVKSPTNTSSLPNVIVGETCAQLKLTDGAYDFGTTAAFTATSVTYDRTFTADRKSTVCLPFALTSEEATALGKFYTLSSYSSETLHFDEVDAPAAYTPYLFVPSATAFASYSSKAIAATPASPKTSVSGADFIGTMTAQSLKSGDGKTLYGYRASDGVFVQIGETNGAHINPFRAYISIPGSVGVKAFNVQLNDLETGVVEVKSDGVKNEKSIYNLAGQRVEGGHRQAKSLQRGVYIVNGKKVLVK